MGVQTRQGLIDYAMRHLGGGVVNIEITPEQLEDAVSDALHHYTEYHFDGLLRSYMVHKVTGTVITVADSTGMSVGEMLENTAGTTKASIVSISGNEITINRQNGFEKFLIGQEVKTVNSPITTITNIVLGDLDNGYIHAGDDIVGVLRILNITNILGSSDYMFNFQYQLMMTEIQALTKAGTSHYWQVMQYLGHLDFVMRKERNFTFNRRTDKLFLEVAWGTEIQPGDIIAAEVYRAIDPAEYPEIYDDIWLKRYVTALVKKQWGTNLKKYSGMQLPGGLTYNGQAIYDEALQEIEKLEQEAIFSASPLEFFVG